VAVESNAQAYECLSLDRHRRDAGRKMLSGMETGAMTPSPQGAWFARPKPIWHHLAHPLALAALCGP
jgi:hypothetical protein